jgi:hypothetical protein
MSGLTGVQPASLQLGNAVHNVHPSGINVWCFQYLSTPPVCSFTFTCVLTFFCFRLVLWSTQPPLQWAPRGGVNHPPPSSAEVKEIIELYLYSTPVPLWPVMVWNLPLPLPFSCFGPSSLEGLNNSVLQWKSSDMQLTTHLHVMSKLGMGGIVFCSPIPLMA